MRRNDCILCSSIDHHKHFFYILHRGRANFGLSIILFISATLGIYKGARRVINFQAASGIKKIGVCLSCCWLLVDPSGKKRIFFADYLFLRIIQQLRPLVRFIDLGFLLV